MRRSIRSRPWRRMGPRIIMTMTTAMSKKKTVPLVKERKDRKRSSSSWPGEARLRAQTRPSTSSVTRKEDVDGTEVGPAGLPHDKYASRVNPTCVLKAGHDETTSPAALYRLMTWLSPSYPVGAFSYSSGIEWAVEAGDVTDADTLQRWLTIMTADGSGFCDGVFFRHAHQAAAEASAARLREVAELSAAFIPSKERQLETTAQGRAFIDATRAAWPCEAIERL